MGLFDWLKRKDAGDPSGTTSTVTTRSVSVDAGADGVARPGDAADLRDPEQREALEQVDRLLHEFLAAGQGSAGSLTVAASTKVVVGGQMVSADDPRARGAMAEAAAKLREHGLDDLAADLEARVAAAPAATVGTRPSAAPAPGEDGLSLPAPGANDDLGEAPSAPAAPEPPAPPS